MAEPVTLVDRNVLKVLSVDTRLEILKELSQGSRTPSHLGKSLKKSDSTIVEHLEALAKAGLVKKVEQPGKKWVFYTLTERGEGIVKSKSRRLVIILSASFMSMVGGLFSYNVYTSMFSDSTFGSAAIEISQKAVEEAARAAPSGSPVAYLYLALALFALGGAGITYFALKKRMMV